jgi:uncharacterized protein YaiI (UPF0178 family)
VKKVIVYVDADACPVKEIIVSECRKRQIPVVMVCDTSHIIHDGYSKTVITDKGANSADFVLANMVHKGDIAVTQDYGLAAMIRSKGGKCLNQNGMVYNDGNIDSLLLSRHIGKKIRRSGGKINSVPKRTKEDDANFEKALVELIKKTLV